MQVMAEMRHPHVVQFLGLCFLGGSELPVLVMERLDSSLDDLLETSPGFPLALKQSLLTDVARGLLHLHTRDPPVVHRDLSARNVLLTSSLVAKISDLGNARIVNLEPAGQDSHSCIMQEHMCICLLKHLISAHSTVPDWTSSHLVTLHSSPSHRSEEKQPTYNCSHVNRHVSFLDFHFLHHQW